MQKQEPPQPPAPGHDTRLVRDLAETLWHMTCWDPLIDTRELNTEDLLDQVRMKLERSKHELRDILALIGACVK